MSDLYKQVERYVIDSYSTDGVLSSRGKHLLKTRDWLLKIYPDADEAMQIAAVAHDIDSAFIDYKFRGSFSDPVYLTKHQTESARIIGDFLADISADEQLISRVGRLVMCHEVGGDNDQNIIKDADSLGFFDRDMDGFIKKHLGRGTSLELIRQKIVWMYDRISDDNTRHLAEPMYNEALRLLEDYNK